MVRGLGGCVEAKARCNSRRCPSCGVLWAGDARRKILVNLEHASDTGLVTVTAPGADLLPWDRSRCSHPAGVKCSGKKHGCQVQAAAAQDFNQAAPGNWSGQHRTAAGRARYLARKSGGAWRVVAREWEFQARGVLHMHVVVPMGTALERRCSYVYVAALRELAGAHGFGNVDSGRPTWIDGKLRRPITVIPSGGAARYLAKYLAAFDGCKLTLSETVTHPDVPPHLMFVSRCLTGETGCTMRSLRVRRSTWCYGRGLVAQLGEGWARVVLEHADALGDQAQDAVEAIRLALGP